MEWKDISSTVGKIAPALGALLAVPTGGASIAIGQAIAAVLGSDSTPEAVAHAIANNPDAALKLQAMENEHKQAMKKLENEQEQNRLTATAENAKAVNTTMQAEAAAEHWPTYSWRPFIGFIFGLYIASMFILPLFGIRPEPMSSDLVLVIGGILGVASFFRGKMQADPSIPTVNRG